MHFVSNSCPFPEKTLSKDKVFSTQGATCSRRPLNIIFRPAKYITAAQRLYHIGKADISLAPRGLSFCNSLPSPCLPTRTASHDIHRTSMAAYKSLNLPSYGDYSWYQANNCCCYTYEEHAHRVRQPTI